MSGTNEFVGVPGGDLVTHRPDERGTATERIRTRAATWTLVACRAVYLSPDDAKTDVILAAVAAVLGVSLRAYVVSLPLYPRTGLAGAFLELLWIVALTALVPILLARYRQDGPAAFGLAGSGTGRAWGWGLLLAVPAVLVGIIVRLIVNAGGLGAGGGLGAPLGRLAGPVATGDLIALAFVSLQVLLFSMGALILAGFLAVRSREAFPRSPEVPLAQLVRTIGSASVGVAVVGGLLRALGGASLTVALVNALGLAAILLLVDRRIPAGLRVPRTAVLAPVVVVVIGNILNTGGLFRGDLLAGLTFGALAAGVTLAIASFAQTRDGVAIAIPLVFAVHLWPTCLSPLVLVGC